MGLERLDLLLDSERVFGVTVSDAEAASVRTPREVMDLMIAKVQAVPTADHRVQDLYFDLRRGFRSALGQKASPRLDDLLTELFEAADWPHVWDEVRLASGRTDLPEKLRRPGSFWSGIHTLRDLVWALAFNLAPSVAPSRPWTREEVALRVRALIVEQGRSRVGFDENLTWREIGWP